MSKLHGHDTFCISPPRRRMMVIVVLSWDPLEWTPVDNRGRGLPQWKLAEDQKEAIEEFLLERRPQSPTNAATRKPSE